MSTAGQHSVVWPDITGQAWREQAACVGRDPRWWEPADSHVDLGDVARWTEAAKVCAGCPVLARCASDVTREDAGSIRAGLYVSGTGRLKAVPTLRGPRRTGGGQIPPSPCGTLAARRRHQNRKESCEPCRTGAFGKKALAECGTKVARQRHRRNRETCTACGVTP